MYLHFSFHSSTTQQASPSGGGGGGGDCGGGRFTASVTGLIEEALPVCH